MQAKFMLRRKTYQYTVTCWQCMHVQVQVIYSIATCMSISLRDGIFTSAIGYTVTTHLYVPVIRGWGGTCINSIIKNLYVTMYTFYFYYKTFKVYVISGFFSMLCTHIIVTKHLSTLYRLVRGVYEVLRFSLR